MQEGYSPCYKIPNVPVVFDKKRWGLEKDWAPKNAGDEFDELSLTLKYIFEKNLTPSIIDLRYRDGAALNYGK